MKLHTVIFDMDGVIFDTENLLLKCWRKLADRHEIQNIETVYNLCIGTTEVTSKAIFEEHYGTRFTYDTLAQEAGKEFFTYVKQNGMPMKPGVRELLDYLKEKPYRIGLASSTREELVRSQLAGRDLLSYFEVVICGDMVEKGKPAPDIYLKACREIGTPPQQAYAIEDSYNGIYAATQAGMQAIMVPDLVAPDEEMERLTCRILPSLMEVIQFLEEE